MGTEHPVVVRRSGPALALRERGGAGAGPHQDRRPKEDAWSRRCKHKGRRDED